MNIISIVRSLSCHSKQASTWKTYLKLFFGLTNSLVYRLIVVRTKWVSKTYKPSSRPTRRSWPPAAASRRLICSNSTFRPEESMPRPHANPEAVGCPSTWTRWPRWHSHALLSSSTLNSVWTGFTEAVFQVPVIPFKCHPFYLEGCWEKHLKLNKELKPIFFSHQ